MGVHVLPILNHPPHLPPRTIPLGRPKCNIQKTKSMASSPITSWQIDGETMETVADFIFLGSQITADGDCSREIKRRLFLEEKLWQT